MMSDEQLILPIHTDESKLFSGFHNASNSSVVNAIRFASTNIVLPGNFTYLYGDRSSGKTHLLLASCAHAQDKGYNTMYVDVNQLLDTTFLQDRLSEQSLVCVDQLEALEADSKRQKELLSLCEHVRNNGGSMVMAGRKSPTNSPIDLLDLRSRIKAFPGYELFELEDVEKQLVLRGIAKRKGFKLSSVVTRWLLTHKSRDLAYLVEFLDRIDTLSLVQKRRVTIPLIKGLN